MWMRSWSSSSGMAWRRRSRWAVWRCPSWLTLCTICAVMLELCEDRAYCQVLAESTTFSQDPCPDTYKYLEVHYKCRPNEFEKRTVCEGEQMELVCPRAKRLAIYSALFGRVPNGTGTPCPPNRPGYINCQSTETVSEVRTACQGRKRCDIQASEAVFGNPCAAGINKYLSVTFACVPKKILKQLRRHRGRLSPGRKRKKKKKKKDGEKKDQVTKLSGADQDEDTTSPSGELSEELATRVLETYHSTDTVKKDSADSAVKKDRAPGADQPHHLASTPTPPSVLVPVANREQPTDFNVAGSDRTDNADPDTPRFDPERASSGPVTHHFKPGSGANSDHSGLGADRDSLGGNSDGDFPQSNQDSHSPGSDPENNYPGVEWGNSGRDRNRTKDLSELTRPKVDEGRDNSVSGVRPGVPDSGARDKEMSTEAAGSGAADGVTDSGLTVLCTNHTLSTMGTPTVRTLPSNNEAPIGVVREIFSVVRFVQGHQEKAILYLILGMCVGLILLLTTILGRVCYKLKHNTHAKLDMTEPTHSRNVSHLVHHNHHHSLLEAPMLEHSDSIDRIEVVRFEPRGTMRSGYHSTLHSDSGDRSLNNYYG